MTLPMPPFRALAGALFGTLALLPLGVAQAAAVATYFGYANAKDWDPLFPQEQIISQTTATPAAYTALAGGNKAESVTDSANGGSVYANTNSTVVPSPFGFDVSGSAGATTQLNYRVQLVGPDAPVVIPVRVVANGYINSTGMAYGQLDFVVNYDSGGSSGQLFGSQRVDFTGSTIFSFDQVANFKVNAFFDVYLSVSAASGFVGATANGSSTAFLDPMFTIDDPVYASLYHFENVPGVVPSVPEPASWALALLGLGVVCGARRARAAKA